MSLGTPALGSMLHDPLLKFIKPLLRAQHVGFFWSQIPTSSDYHPPYNL